ncbi:MAG: response regulator [Verrucomicrobia bacterium]|nr:response regulator [Verrucomicrobiota bacterium]
MSNRRFKIVLADDNLVVLKVLSLKLAAHGFEVVAISESDQIIARVSEEVPDLIVLDQHFGYQVAIGSPEWNGLKILRWMNRLEHLRDIPIIIMTADESVELKADALKYGASAFLHKPLDYEQLVRLCTTLSGSARPPVEAPINDGVDEPVITAVPTAPPPPAPEPVEVAPAEKNFVF